MPFRLFSVALPVLISLLFSSVAVAKPPELTLANVYQKGMPLDDYWIKKSATGCAHIGPASDFFPVADMSIGNPVGSPEGFRRAPLDGALKVHIRRFKEVHRPNPGSGGTTLAKTELQESQDGDWWVHRRFLPDGIEYWLETPRPKGLVFHEWKIRARMVADLGTDREYVFPAPPVSDPLVYQEIRHGDHQVPDFTRDDVPFWASLTTNRRALSFHAYRQSKRLEGASDV